MYAYNPRLFICEVNIFIVFNTLFRVVTPKLGKVICTFPSNNIAK